MSTVTSDKSKALNDDAPQKCDRTPAIPTNTIYHTELVGGYKQEWMVMQVSYTVSRNTD
jgi:hypothetical protein